MSFGPCPVCQRLVPACFSYWLALKPLHSVLGDQFSPASPLALLAALCSPPVLAKLGCFLQASEMLLLLQCKRNVTTHIEKLPLLTPFLGGRLAGYSE